MTVKVAGEHIETGKRYEADLLMDKLVSQKEIVKSSERYRTLDSESAYGAIEKAYRELLNELKGAKRAR